MDHDLALELWRQALVTAATVSAPFLAAGIVVGVATALFQAATQVHENAISFVPKIAVIGFILALSGPWLLERLTTFSAASIARIADVGRGGGR